MPAQIRRTPQPGVTGAAFKNDEQLRRRLNQTNSTKMNRAQACCRECDAQLSNRQTDFCGATCRAIFHNRRSRRGAEILDLALAWRFDRRRAAQAKALTLLCRALAQFRAEDIRERGGRPSWDDVVRVRMRAARLTAITGRA